MEGGRGGGEEEGGELLVVVVVEVVMKEEGEAGRGREGGREGCLCGCGCINVCCGWDLGMNDEMEPMERESCFQKCCDVMAMLVI